MKWGSKDAIDSLFLTKLRDVLEQFGISLEDVDIDMKARTVDCTKAVKTAGFSSEQNVALAQALEEAVGNVAD